MTTEKMKETLSGQFKLWHGIVSGVAIILINIAVVSWRASHAYGSIVSDISTLKAKAANMDSNYDRISERVLTNSITDKQSWLAFRESTISRMASYEANQTQIITQLSDLNYQLRDIFKHKK